MSSALQDQQRELFLSSRDRHPPNEAVRYIENNVALPGQPLPVFSELSGGFVTLDEANQQREKSTAMWKEVDAEKEHLFTLMEQVQQRLTSKKSAGDRTEDTINLRQCNWRVVMEEVRKTAQRWKSRPSKQGKTMMFIDKVGQHSAALEKWLGLLPMGDYGSSICGVFKLAIGAAGQYSKVEEAIFEALSEIPRIMESTGRYVNMYRQMRDQFLEERTIELFRAVLRLLRHVMQFLADDKSKKIIGSILKQDSYKAELIQCVEEINTRVQAVNDEALQCQGRLLCKVYEETHQTQQVFHRLMDFLLTNPRFQDSDSEPHSLENEPSRLKLSSYDMVNINPATLSEEKEDTILQTTPRKTPDSLAQRNDQMTTYFAEAETARRRLLQVLHHDPDKLSRDISSSLWLGNQLSETMKARAAAMIRHDMFRSFIEETQSSTRLLVNGRGDISTLDGISPLSIVVAELARKAEEKAEQTPVFTVKYFCAQNPASSFGDPLSFWDSGAIGMMASLISQLLCQLTDRGIVADLSFMTDSRWRKLEQFQPKTFLTVFQKLVKQMPSGSVLLCMIDEISLYETQMHAGQTNTVMAKLVQLTDNTKSDGHPVFKLLVTSHDRALDVSDHFFLHTLDLQEDIEADDQAEWTISTMA